MRTKSRNPFSTIRTEGGLLPAEFLQRVAQGDKGIDGLTPEAYHLAGNLKLNEAINRSWNVLLGAWEKFKTESEKVAPLDTGTSTTRNTWLLPLFQELGYGRLQPAKAVEIEEKSYPVSHAWTHLPIHLVGLNAELDRRSAGVAGAARMSPHGLVQELLNRSDECLWAMLSNGHRLRILRDNVSLTRQAYVEFDLYAMMEGEVYSDFVVLWLVCHQSRVEAKSELPATSSDHSPFAIHHSPSTCLLERWMQDAAKLGTRALEHLRDGVEKAIETLGAGFVGHPDNRALKDKLRSGELNKQDLYREVLRIVYRIIFLFVAEDRELLHPPDADPEARRRYQRYYSTHRLRELAERKAGTKHGDLWQMLQLVFGALGDDEGCPALALPCLGSFLWSREATAELNHSSISNRDLLDAIRHLAVTVDGNVRRVVDYRNLGSEELGSIYESLLEMHPDVNVDAGTFDLNVAAGNERKTTGSYYTPSSLVNCLLDSALEPVIADKLKEAAKSGTRHDELRKAQEEALLGMSVCDPACGSGHFLIAAAHRMAKRLAAVRTGDDEPSPEAIQTALRDVVGHCIYGIDINPMAVELCKVSLWMEAMTPGKPLSFLDHRIVCGNSLLGATPALIERGIPDDAFKPIEGDDKKLCSEFKKQNKQERSGQGDMFFDMVRETRTEYLDLTDRSRSLDRIDDATPAGVRRKEQTYAGLVNSPEYGHRKLVADAWCAAFVWRKTKDFPYAITEQVLRRIEDDSTTLDRWMRDEIDDLTRQYAFLHLHVAFPDVFIPLQRIDTENLKGWTGGFDVILGNPPWERISLKEKEFFHGMPDITGESDSSRRAVLIDSLAEESPSLHSAFLSARGNAMRQKHLLSSSGRFPLTGRGDLNTSALFTELVLQLQQPEGRVGIITQTQVVTEKTYAALMRYLLDNRCIAQCYAFENERFLFPAAHHSTRFVLLTLAAGASEIRCASAIWATDWLHDERRLYTVTASDVLSMNPDTAGIPQFRARRDAQVSSRIYSSHRTLRMPSGLRSETTISRVMHDKDDASVLHWDRKSSEMRGEIPVLESKLFAQYNAKYATYDGVSDALVKKGYPRQVNASELSSSSFSLVPRKWVAIEDTPSRFRDFPQGWLLHVRKIARNIDIRTIISALTPKFPNNGSCAWIRNDSFASQDYLFLTAVLNSLVFDYLARQKIGGMNVNSYHLFQIPVPSLPSEAHEPLHSAVVARVIELSYTDWSMAPLALDAGYACSSGEALPPFRWDEPRRWLVKCELDALVAHAYGLQKADVEWVLDADHPSESFRVLKEAEQRQYGEYRTKHRIIQLYDEMAEAMKTGEPYQTHLSPPPGPPADEHGNFLPLPEWLPGQPQPANWPPHIHTPRGCKE